MAQIVTVKLAKRSGQLLFVLWGLEILQAFASWRWLTLVGQITFGLYLLIALRGASTRILAICAVLLAGAAVVLWRWGHLEGLEQGVQSSFHFAAFFAALQFLRGLSERIPEVRYTRLAVSRAGPAASQILLLVVGHIIGAVFAAGSLFLLASMVSSHDDQTTRLANAMSALRGLGMAAAWSPFFVALALVDSLTPGAPTWQLIALGIPPAALLVVGGCLAIGLRHSVDFGQIWRSVVPVQKLALPLVGAVAVLTSVTGMSNLTIVALIVPCVALLARWARPQTDLFSNAVRTQAALSRLNEEVLLISVALMLGQVVVASPEFGTRFLEGDFPPLPAFVYLLMSAGVVFLGGFVGLHPLLSTSLSLPVMHKMGMEICPPVLISAAALVGWSAANIVSVWAVPVLVAGHAFKVPVRCLSRGPNLVYAVGYILAGVAFLALVASVHVV